MGNTSGTRRKMIAKVKIGFRQLQGSLGMSDDDYRAMLNDRYGQRSAADLTVAELADCIEHMARLGAEFTATKKSARADIRKVWALWGDLEALGVLQRPGKAGCVAWVKRMTGIDSPEWLNVDQARSCIEALKSWRDRERKQVSG
jgi:phage gp16-like protein